MHALLFVLAAPLFWGALEPGTHSVGFRVESAMSAPGSAGWQPRAIQVATWYPSESNKRAPITFGEYFELASDLRRRSGGDTLPRALSASITGDAEALDDAQTKAILGARMHAVRDAQPLAGPYPVILFSARYGSVAAQSVLAEHLASRGYVVAAMWPKDAQEKLPFELKTAAEKYEELDAQTDDLRGALRAVRALPIADDARTAVIAWSYAGESAWQLAQGDARIEAVIGLDTNVRANWVYRPQELASIASVPERARFLDFDKASFPGLAHGNFNALEGMIPAVMGIDRVQRWSKSGKAAKAGYEAIVQRVASAIEDVFKRKPAVSFETVEIRASDGATVTSELYRATRASGRCVALFHQSGSSRGEYRTIAPELARMGHTALAADVRWGHFDRWNDVVNENAKRHGTPDAMQRRDRPRIDAIKAGEMLDLDAAVDWLQRNGCSGPVIVWGASIQANGVFELAARRPGVVAAIVDVSPGEYRESEPQRMRTIVATVKQPTLVLWGRTEETLSKPVFDAVAATAKTSYGSSGRHGNSMFFEDPGAWAALRAFLAAHGR